MTYNELTRRHFENPRRAGRLDGHGILRGAAGSRAQGTWVQFEVRLAEAPPPGAVRVLEAASFLAFGCPHVIAIADWVAATAPGRPADAGLPDGVQWLRAQFEVPVEKTGRLLVIEDAWIAAFSAPP